MNPEEALAAVRRASKSVPRPELMICGTCSCDDCVEHNQTLLSHTPETIKLQELGNPGWDPICFASDRAFAYYLPGMERMAFEDAGYIDQLLFHLSCPGRVEALNRAQATAARDALWVMVEGAGEDAERFFDERLMEEAIGRLEEKAKEGC